MPTPTYTPLAEITLGSSASSVTFSSITSGIYRDLIVVITGTGSVLQNVRVRFNGDTGSNYSWVRISGTGSSANTNTNTTSYLQLDEFGAMDTSVMSNRIVQIFDYATTDKDKTVLVRSNLSSSGLDALAGRWASTAAITSIVFTIGASAQFSVGSTFALYGIAA